MALLQGRERGYEPGSYGWNIGSNWAAGVMGAWRGASASPIDSAAGATAIGTVRFRSLRRR